ncbi:hypothetical protein [Sanguibacter sp. Leaf3]|uniref:hypothetical protein n=1 Tax=Sanguibacter sp. Leaf3 TaxID=1736209 RepID=UPI0012E3EAB2|nr:hypothetical protein [Sanguibacter sp. Leaf3]
MVLKLRVIGLVAAVALSTGALSGIGSVITAAPASAASCTVTHLGWWSVKNSTCSSARHFNVIKGTSYKYAVWVGKGGTSSQTACWSNATTYGFDVKI